MNHMPAPTQTLCIMESILATALDAAQRLEVHIDDLCAELRNERADWYHTANTIRLTAARSELVTEITRAANALRTVTALRERAGMSEHVIVRVMRECGV